jgi:hypothetical protein
MLACWIVACFAVPLMSPRRPWSWLIAAIVCVLSPFAGCYAETYTEHYSAPDTAVGEEHEINFSAADASQLTRDALDGDGLLFEVMPDNSIVTLWRDADINTPTGWLPTLMGVQPRYRYEIQVVPEASRKSKIIVNVRTEGIPDEQIPSYKATSRFALFQEVDELAAKYPPPTGLPTTGGVNFTLLPKEDLKSLAKRATGSAANWREIAKDNGLTSPTDVTPFENIWVRNSLLKSSGPSAQ